jgi:hypothetical protein
MPYCTITPREGAETPQMGWQFTFDSVRYPLDGRAFTPEQAEHARAYFTPRPAAGEAECLVEIEEHEGDLQMTPVAAAPQKQTCPVCQEFEAEYAELVAHIPECAINHASP